MAELTVNVVSAERAIWSGPAKMAVAKTPEGEIGILPGHEPVLALLVEGALRVEETNGQVILVAVHGGFFSVDDNVVNVISEVAELAEDIDVARAKEALARAEAAGEPKDESAIRRAETRLNVAAAAKPIAHHH